MKRHSYTFGVALVVLALAGLAGPAAAGEQVPFKGPLDGDVSHTPVDSHTDSVVVRATGTAAHLGDFDVTIPHLVNTTTRTAVGTYEFTAANGDTLTADFTGASVPTDAPGVIYIVETATITGGTGRFQGATGSFIVTRLFDRIAGTTTGSFEGSVTPTGAASK